MYNVINKLNKNEKFIGFRESKLTRILEPYLGGNSYTAIICNIHPLQSNYQESINTLRFALCAGGIKNNVKINISTNGALKAVEDFKNELSVVQKTQSDLEEQLEQIQNALEENDRKKIEYQIKVEKVNQDIILLGDKLRTVDLNLRAASDTYELTLETNNDNKEEIEHLTQ